MPLGILLAFNFVSIESEENIFTLYAWPLSLGAVIVFLLYLIYIKRQVKDLSYCRENSVFWLAKLLEGNGYHELLTAGFIFLNLVRDEPTFYIWLLFSIIIAFVLFISICWKTKIKKISWRFLGICISGTLSFLTHYLSKIFGFSSSFNSFNINYASAEILVAVLLFSLSLVATIWERRKLESI